jgi:hypothetical protein
MTQFSSPLSKVKQVETALRKVIVDYGKAVNEIDRALAGRRTQREREALESLKTRCADLRRQTYYVAFRLYDDL